MDILRLKISTLDNILTLDLLEPLDLRILISDNRSDNEATLENLTANQPDNRKYFVLKISAYWNLQQATRQNFD
ncbi:CLUMA_CG014617, isoform A [Clunio marinus]|uniref:CLUMA_CG014617, isoform A n=1 Tax=Clunio marinus TaxID=568069 RepID=A0A1J1INA3_9DIPT|nr:CLUMA_CG014617, isoform A [Clunio marinus]